MLSDDGILYVWIFDEEVINNTPWEEIVENGEDFIWSELTLKELIDMNWIIEYDGN
ncbi:hypothetical protein [Mangrovimonas xylaniphaga]|uniref:hypothetical protein n=1 Tax=Mangrovimonas xylaniphaga TaxID=1645915 RepID=UPI000B19F050|nr:hypothetical protein [Mangrovimonas xylaniphaga]